jgi:hypothetical protein
MLRVNNTEAHGSGAGPVEGCKMRRMRIRFFVNQVVNIPLTIDGDRLAAMPRHFGKTHKPEQPMQLQRFGMGKFYERKAVGSHRVLRGDCSRRGIVRERAHVNSFIPPPASARSARPIAFRNAGRLSLLEEPGRALRFQCLLTPDAIHV